MSYRVLGSSKLVSRWIAVTLAVSIIAAIDGGFLDTWAALAPARIWRGELWRLATWSFIVSGPYCLLLTCVAIYYFGGQLATRWGERRLRRFMIEVLVGAALATTLFALISGDAWRMYRGGGWAVSDALVIAWARQFPDADLVLYGLVRLRGRDLITVTIGITAVYALFSGLFTWLPELAVCAAAYRYPTERLARA
jgi:membrane associated rhomboid family serine protease